MALFIPHSCPKCFESVTLIQMLLEKPGIKVHLAIHSTPLAGIPPRLFEFHLHNFYIPKFFLGVIYLEEKYLFKLAGYRAVGS